MKWLRRGLAALFILWLVFCVLLWLLLNQLFEGGSRPLYEQTRYAQILANPAHFAVDIQRFECVHQQLQCVAISSLGNQVPDARYGKPIRAQLQARGLTLPEYGESIGIIVMLHGKGGRKEEMVPVAMRYVASGFTVVLLDLPMHGMNTQPLLWATGKNDGDIAISALTDFSQLTQRENEPAFLWGISMGAAYVNRTAQQHGQAVNGIIIVSAYDRFERVLANGIRELPTSLQTVVIWQAKAIARLRGLNIEASVPNEWATAIKRPILQIHGDQDELIPIELGKSLFNSYQSRDKQWITVTGAGHNDVLLTRQPVYAETIEWLYRHATNKSLRRYAVSP